MACQIWHWQAEGFAPGLELSRPVWNVRELSGLPGGDYLYKRWGEPQGISRVTAASEFRKSEPPRVAKARFRLLLVNLMVILK